NSDAVCAVGSPGIGGRASSGTASTGTRNAESCSKPFCHLFRLAFIVRVLVVASSGKCTMEHLPLPAQSIHIPEMNTRRNAETGMNFDELTSVNQNCGAQTSRGESPTSSMKILGAFGFPLYVSSYSCRHVVMRPTFCLSTGSS